MRFDPRSQEPVGLALIGNPGGSGVYAFDSANGRLANLGESVKVWDLETGQQLGRDLPGRFFNIDDTADGTDTWSEIACNLAGRNLSEDEWNQLGPRTIERRATCPRFPLP